MAQTPRYHQSLHQLNGIHFISATTYNRTSYFSDISLCLILQQQLMFYSQQYKIELLGFVIMPDHFHCLIWPKGEKTFSDFMRGVKSYSGKKIFEEINRRGLGTPPMDVDSLYYRRGPQTPPLSNDAISARKIWQDSFFTYLIDSIYKLEEKLEYIKQNPVEAGFVSIPDEYKWLYVNPKIYEIEF